MTIHSVPWHIEPAQRPELNANNDSDEDLDEFPYLEHIDNITDLESQAPRSALPLREIYPGASAPLCDYIAEPSKRNAQRCLERKLQNNP